MIRCPYCLNKVKPPDNSNYICPVEECSARLPRDYVEKQGIPRFTIGSVGFTGHGKTVYLTALFYLLKILKRRNIWGSDFAWISLDEHTHKIMYKHVPLLEDSRLPDGTPENFPLPALIQFSNILHLGDYFLSFYDTAGRVYEATEKITDMGRFVAHSEVVLFFVSITDCGNRWADKMEELLGTYIIAVYDRLHINLKKYQHLVVVLSKMDEVRELPEDLKRFLHEGSYKWWNLIGNPNDKLRDKIGELKRTSALIKGWLEEKDCGGFTTLAKNRFKSVEYTIVSSTGAKPIGNKLATRLNPEDPKRVLDPFLWVLEKTRPKGIWERMSGNFK